MTNDELNRLCAEALEPHQDVFDWAIKNPNENKLLRQPSPKGAWILRNLACVLEPADFLTSESANAMLLEAMPFASLSRFAGTVNTTHLVSDVPFWSCWALNHAVSEHPDRKTAIVLAFVAWVKAGGKP